MDTINSSREFAWIRDRLTDFAPVGESAAVIATNLQGQVAYWNDDAEALYGWSKGEALGRDILDLTPATYTREQSAEIMVALQAGDPWQGEILLQRRDGAPVMAFVLNVPVGDFEGGQGTIVGISGCGERGASIQHNAAQYGDAIRRRFEAA